MLLTFQLRSIHIFFPYKNLQIVQNIILENSDCLFLHILLEQAKFGFAYEYDIFYIYIYIELICLLTY